MVKWPNLRNVLLLSVIVLIVVTPMLVGFRGIDNSFPTQSSTSFNPPVNLVAWAKQDNSPGLYLNDSYGNPVTSQDPVDVTLFASWSATRTEYYTAKNDTSGAYIYGGPGSIGSAAGTNFTRVFQSTLNGLTRGGSIYLPSGIYQLSCNPGNTGTPCITIPYGLSYYFYGDGVPSFVYPATRASTYATPPDGTQIRGPSSLLHTGTEDYMIFGATGASQLGNVGWYNLAIMPAWGVTTKGTIVYGYYDSNRAMYLEDNVMFVPWGWTEAGEPSPSSSDNVIRSQSCSAAGGGARAIIGTLTEWGMEAGSTFGSQDIVTINNVLEDRGNKGLNIGADTATITFFDSIDMSSWSLAIATDTFVDAFSIREFMIENPSVEPSVNYFILLLHPSVPRLRVDAVWIIKSKYSYKYTSITNNDVQLEGVVHVWGFGTGAYGNGIGPAMWQNFPLNKAINNAWGAQITRNLLTTSTTDGYYYIGDNAAGTTTWTSGRRYMDNVPVDITITAGTGQSITTVDYNGNTIDNGAATITHRLLLPGYTIRVTFTSIGTVTVYQATVGLSPANGFQAASPTASVNYVVYGYDVFIDASGGTGLSISTYDGSSNTRGNTIDSGLSSITHYGLSPGQIINFGPFTGSPTISVVRGEG